MQKLFGKTAKKPIFIGIGGDSCAGKRTFSALIERLFGESNVTCIDGDDMHRWNRQSKNWDKYTHLNPKSNMLHQDLAQVSALIRGETITRRLYDHSVGDFTHPKKVEPNKIIIYRGLHPFYLSRMRNMFDVKVYMDPDENLRKRWKFIRDQKERGYTAEAIMHQINVREEDAIKYIRPQREFADIIVSLLPGGQLKDGKNSELKLHVTCDNSLCLEPLVKSVSRAGRASAEHFYEDDLYRQRIEFDGVISAWQINQVAHSLIPNFKELTGGEPDWGENLDGLRQLFFLYYFSEIRKANYGVSA